MLLLALTFASLVQPPDTPRPPSPAPQTETLSALLDRIPLDEDGLFVDERYDAAIAAIVAVRNRVRDGNLTDAEWRLFIDRRILRTPAKWPRSLPLQFNIATPTFYWADQGTEVHITPRLTGAKVVRAGRTWTNPCGNSAAMQLERERSPLIDERRSTLAAPLPPTGDISFDVEVRVAGEWGYREWQENPTTFSGVVTRHITLSDHIDDVITPRSGPAIDAAVHDAVRIHLVPSTLDGPIDRIDARISLTAPLPLVRKTAIGLRLELRRDDVVIETFRLPARPSWQQRYLYDPTEVPAPLSPETRKQLAALLDPREHARWSIRVIGDAEMSLSAWNLGQYWAGEYTIKLDNSLVQPPAPRPAPSPPADAR